MRLVHALLKILQVGGHRRVRVVVRESPVRLEEQAAHLATEGAEQRRRHDAAHPVAGIQDQARALRAEPEVPLHEREVGLEDVLLSHGAATALEVPARDQVAQSGDLGAVHGRRTHPHLEPVVLRGIVRTGDHRLAVRLQGLGGEVAERGGHQSDVDHVAAGLIEPTGERIAEAHRGFACVASHDDLGGARRGGRARWRRTSVPRPRPISATASAVRS